MTPTRSGNYFNIHYFGAHIHYLLIEWPEIEGMFYLACLYPSLSCAAHLSATKPKSKSCSILILAVVGLPLILRWLHNTEFIQRSIAR